MVLFKCRMILYICDDFRARTSDFFPNAFQRLYFDVIDTQDIVELILQIVHADAVNRWPYTSSWRPLQRHDGPLARAENELRSIHSGLRSVAGWMSHGDCPNFAIPDDVLTKSLNTLQKARNKLRDSFVAENRHVVNRIL